MKTITIADNETFLRTKSKEVVFPDDDLERDIKVLEAYFKESDITLALASVQLGILKRIIYIKNSNLDLINRKNNDLETEDDKEYNEKRILINPVIISKEGLTDYWEACASCLDNIGHVKRPYKINLEYQDLEGVKHKDVYEGFEATVLSHEMDHLDGILHMDIADEVLNMTREERKEFRKTHVYNVISEVGDYEELLNNSKKYVKSKN